MRIHKSRKERAKAKVRRDLTALARRGDLTLEAFEAVALSYNPKHWAEAARYAKRLLALFRAGVFTAYEVAGGKWLQIEERARSLWYTPEGQIMPRYLHEMELEALDATRPLPKSARPLCAATSQKGKPCQAKARPGSVFCLKHSQEQAAPEA